ncbi:MAG TPA: hypothetical protein VLZ81_14340 [Blastocatellia bacterium]|nr:hypothetical protein [Blastocatellia bacterium]
MFKFASRILTMAMVLVMASLIALADNKKDTVTFPRDIMVNGTVVKAGTYKVQYDEKANELSIIKDKKAIAKVTGHVETLERKANNTQVLSSSKDDKDVLTGITFGGDNHKILLSEGDGQASK